MLDTERCRIGQHNTIDETNPLMFLLACLLPSMGLAGAAWAMTAGFTVSSSILLKRFCAASHLSLVDILKFRKHDFIALSQTVRTIRGKAVLNSR